MLRWGVLSLAWTGRLTWRVVPIMHAAMVSGTIAQQVIRLLFEVSPMFLTSCSGKSLSGRESLKKIRTETIYRLGLSEARTFGAGQLRHAILMIFVEFTSIHHGRIEAPSSVFSFGHEQAAVG